jgi:hypothetical protein
MFRAILLLDFDTREAYREFPMRARFLARWLDIPLSSFRIRRRRTVRGWHVVVFLSRDFLDTNPLCHEPVNVVLAQLILGSDWRREIFNFVRVLHLKDAPESWQQLGRWNTLYTRKMGAYDNGIQETAPPVVHNPSVKTDDARGQTDGN